MKDQADIVKAIKAHAEANYGKSGWDVIVECFDDSEIKEVLDREKITTIKDGIKAFQEIADLQQERRQEQQSEIF